MNSDNAVLKSEMRAVWVVVILLAFCLVACACYELHTTVQKEIRREADAISLAESLPRTRLAKLVEQSIEIVQGKRFQPAPRSIGVMWDEQTGFPEGFADIRPYRINVMQEDEVWFCIYKNRDTEVVMAVLDLKVAPKVVLRTGLDEHYRFTDRRILYEK